jgi:hypothetical protein
LTWLHAVNDDPSALTARAATRSVVAVGAAGVALLAFSAGLQGEGQSDHREVKDDEAGAVG